VVNRLRSRRLLFAAFVVLVLAAIYGAASLRHPVPAAGYTAARPGSAAVTSAISACAAPGTAAVTSGSLAIAAVPQSASAGSALVTRLVPGGSPAAGPVAATITRPDLLQVTAVKTAPALPKSLQTGQPGSSPNVSTQTARGGVLVSATGAMAQGLEVEQTGPGGLVTEQCGSPGTSFWFVGPGQSSAADIELYLMNTDSQAADVQVTALTDATKGGPLLGNADDGITVPPHGMVVQSLGSLLQTSKVVALNVTTSVGRVVAALRESRRGADDGAWLPAAQAPATRLIIPGLPQTAGSRDLYIAVPGSATATVKVTAVTTRGSYNPTGGTNIELLGGSAAEIPLPALGGVAGAVSISSSVPVAASMLVSGGPAGTPGAMAATAGPVAEQGVLAANPVGSAGSTDLVLSAPAHGASVRITVGTASLPVTGQAGTVLQIKAGSTVVLRVRAPGGRRISQVMIVVTPLAGSGPVYAGRVISSGGVVQSIAAVPSSLTWVPIPVVHSSLTAIVP
jgi:Family of unknown function (DUF5719)